MDQHLLLASQRGRVATEPLAAASEPAPAPAKQGWQANVAGTDLGIFVNPAMAGVPSAAPPLPQWSVLDYARALQTPTAAASLTFAPAATAASLPAPFVDGTGPVPADPQAGVRPERARKRKTLEEKQALFDANKLHFCPKCLRNTGDGTAKARCGSDNGKFAEGPLVTERPALDRSQRPRGQDKRARKVVNDGDERSWCLRSAECSKPRGHFGFCDKRRPLAAQEEEEPVPRPSRAPLSSGEIDCKLWTGAAAAGWSVIFWGRSNYTYIAPDGRAKFSSANKAREHAGDSPVDARLWAGAEAAGWRVDETGRNHYSYVAPDGRRFSSRKAAAEAAAEAEARAGEEEEDGGKCVMEDGSVNRS